MSEFGITLRLGMFARSAALVPFRDFRCLLLGSWWLWRNHSWRGMALRGGHSPGSAPCCCPGVPAQKRARCVHWELLGNVGLWDWCDQDTKRRSQKGLILIVDIFYNYCQKFGPLPSPQMLLIISGVTKTRGFNCPVPASPASISRSISKWLAQEEEGSPPGSLPHAWGRVDD